MLLYSRKNVPNFDMGIRKNRSRMPTAKWRVTNALALDRDRGVQEYGLHKDVKSCYNYDTDNMFCVY